MAIELVQPVKIESVALGGDHDDDYYTPVDAQKDVLETAGIVINDASHRDESTAILRSGLDMLFQDGHNTSPVTLTDLLASGGSGISEHEHEGLSTLVHDVDATTYDQVIYSGFFITGYIIWVDSLMTRKIREYQVTYDTVHTSRVIQVVSIQYLLGVEYMRTTEVYTYLSNGLIGSVQRTKTGGP